MVRRWRIALLLLGASFFCAQVYAQESSGEARRLLDAAIGEFTGTGDWKSETFASSLKKVTEQNQTTSEALTAKTLLIGHFQNLDSEKSKCCSEFCTRSRFDCTDLLASGIRSNLPDGNLCGCKATMKSRRASRKRRLQQLISKQFGKKRKGSILEFRSFSLVFFELSQQRDSRGGRKGSGSAASFRARRGQRSLPRAHSRRAAACRNPSGADRPAPRSLRVSRAKRGSLPDAVARTAPGHPLRVNHGQ